MLIKNECSGGYHQEPGGKQRRTCDCLTSMLLDLGIIVRLVSAGLDRSTQGLHTVSLSYQWSDHLCDVFFLALGVCPSSLDHALCRRDWHTKLTKATSQLVVSKHVTRDVVFVMYLPRITLKMKRSNMIRHRDAECLAVENVTFRCLFG